MASETNCRIWSNSSPDRWSILLSTKNVGDCRAARLFNSVSSRVGERGVRRQHDHGRVGLFDSQTCDQVAVGVNRADAGRVDEHEPGSESGARAALRPWLPGEHWPGPRLRNEISEVLPTAKRPSVPSKWTTVIPGGP